MRWRLGAAALAGAVAACSMMDCGLFLGFEDPIDRQDGGGGASSDHTSTGAWDAATDALPPGDRCVPAAPNGWEGPFVIAERSGHPLPSLPDCPAGDPNERYNGKADPDAPDAMCECSCGAVANATCDHVRVDLYSDANCMTPGAPPNVTVSTSCTMMPGYASLKVQPPTIVPGACPPTPTVTVQPAVWTKNARLCKPDTIAQGACAAGQIETAAATLPFESETYCIVHDGEVACPPEYPAQRVYYGNGTDKRGCTACTCSPPSGASCTGSIQLADNGASCAGGLMVVAAPMAMCTKLMKAGAVLQKNIMFDPGMCKPNMPKPMGAFEPNDPTTICCNQ